MRHEKKHQSKKKKSNRYSNNNRRNTPPKKHFTNKISDHFSKRDFTCKESKKFKISLGLVGALEELRSMLKKRIEIIKGYECPEVAEKKGKLKKNYHTMGLAADIKIEGMSPTELYLAAEKIDAFHGLGLNLDDSYIHVDTRKTERLCWIEQNDTDIELTDENRSRYFA